MNVRFFARLGLFALLSVASYQALAMERFSSMGWLKPFLDYRFVEERLWQLLTDPAKFEAIEKTGQEGSFYAFVSPSWPRQEETQKVEIPVETRPDRSFILAACLGIKLEEALTADNKQEGVSAVVNAWQRGGFHTDRSFAWPIITSFLENVLTGENLVCFLRVGGMRLFKRGEEPIKLRIKSESIRLKMRHDQGQIESLVKAVIDTGMNVEDFDEEFRHIIAPVARAILWPRQAVCVVCRLPLPGKERVLISEYLVGADEARRQVALVEAARAQYEGSTGAASEEEVHMTVRCEMPCELCKTNQAEVMVASADDEAFYNRSPREREQMKFFCKPCADCLCESD